jgi:peptide/nickel transport system substrate-binding protein
MNAFERGDVAVLERVPPDRVGGLRQASVIKVGRYRLVGVHFLAVDGRNPILKNRNLRRAISYAIDRKALLEETIIKRPIDDYNQPADGPFATDSSANAPDVPRLEYDPLRARMLVAMVRREMTAPKFQFRFEYPAIPEAQAAAPRIAEMLRAVGLGIDLVERSESELEEALRAGDRFDLAYRVGRTDAPVREAGNLVCPGFDAPAASDGLGALASPRIMQLLLQLEHAPEWNSARALVQQIDRECRDELPVIPLWQLVDHFAYRENLKGPLEVADHLYQGIERWEIEPWFAKDPW